MPSDQPGPKPSPDLTVAQLARLRQIFDAATELDLKNRAVFVAEACGADEALRVEIEELLAAHDSETGWMDRAILDAVPSQPRGGSSAVSWIGRSIGPYRVVKELGSGGMATVYLAERRIGKLLQPVALKIIRSVLATNEQMMRRFEHEREILASLDHPNIARLLDIGSTEDGIPYLVMDFVEGERIDVYCDLRKLGIVDRLELFRTACSATQYAHSKGVIHRDLKPSNILITAEGAVKLLDFGIAKVLHANNATGTFLTESGAALMTLEYASPEQVRGDAVGPASDVYSLGVLLFELLTGRRPYRTEGRMMHAIAQAICEEQPMSPSSAINDPGAPRSFSDQDAPTAQYVSVSTVNEQQNLRRQLSGDLDSILLKSLRKEPQWRYASPAEFSDDIGRHLSGSRVMARDDTFHYRLERIVRRILYPSTGVFHTQGMMMFTSGLLGVGFLMERQDILSGRKKDVNVALDLSLVALWFCWALWEGRRMTHVGRFSALDRQSWIVFSVIVVVLGVLSLVSELGVTITPQAMAIFWIAGLAIGLLIVGVQASRVLTAGGIALFVSAIIASFFPQIEYLCLAGGVIFGLVIPGLLIVLRPGKS